MSTIAPPCVGLIRACDDPQLLGITLWPRQRELLQAVEAGPRIHVWSLGRRSGKTLLAALVGLWCCLLRPELQRSLRPGERGWAVGIATNLRQARLLVRAAGELPLELVDENGELTAFFYLDGRKITGPDLDALMTEHGSRNLTDDEAVTEARAGNPLAGGDGKEGDDRNRNP